VKETVQPVRESVELVEDLVATGPTRLLTAFTQPDLSSLTSILEPFRDLLAVFFCRKRPRAGLGIDETTDEARLVPPAVTGMLASRPPGTQPKRTMYQSRSRLPATRQLTRLRTPLRTYLEQQTILSTILYSKTLHSMLP
jgi:hypothetical protein